MPKNLSMNLAAQIALRAFLADKLALDANLDVRGMVKGVSHKTWGVDKSRIKMALDSALMANPKALAKDADVSGVMDALDQLDPLKDEMMGEADPLTDPEAPLDDKTDAASAAISENPDAAVVKPDADAVDPNAPNPMIEFLKGKLSDEDLAEFEDLHCQPAALDSSTFPPKSGEASKLFKPAMDKDDKMVTKPAMDQAIAKALITQHNASMALDQAREDVKPIIGNIDRSAGTASAVYKMALDEMKVDVTGVPEEGFGPLFRAMPKPGVQAFRTASMAMDAGAAKGFEERFPTANKLKMR